MTSRATGETRSVDAGGCWAGVTCSAAASRKVYWIMNSLGRGRGKSRSALDRRQRVLRKTYGSATWRSNQPRKGQEGPRTLDERESDLPLRGRDPCQEPRSNAVHHVIHALLEAEPSALEREVGAKHEQGAENANQLMQHVSLVRLQGWDGDA